MIEIQDASVIKPRAGCGQTKHQKYGAYLKPLEDHPDILPYLLDNIDKDPNKQILIKAVDMGPALGRYFETVGETAMHWALKFVLFIHGIYISTTTSTEINPKTNKGYLLLKMRRAKPGDELSEELRKHLEPTEMVSSDQEVQQCAIEPWSFVRSSVEAAQL